MKMSIDKVVAGVRTAASKFRDYFSVPTRLKSMREYAVRNYADSDALEQMLAGKTDEEKQAVFNRIEDKLQSAKA